jgi:hypothetical protein
MSPADVEILRDERGRTQILVDGRDIADAVQGYTLTAKAGHVPGLALDLVVHEINTYGEVDLYVADRSRELLLAHGWKEPPPKSITLFDDNPELPKSPEEALDES